MDKFIIAVTLIILSVTLIILGGTFAQDHDVSYVGEEYTVFKQEFANAVLNKNVRISEDERNYMTVLSSSPPIVVLFDISANKDYYFPYGERGNEPISGGWIMLGIGIACFAGAILLLHTTKEV